MEFIAKIRELGSRVDTLKDGLETEEATKNACIMPFLHSVLGYDIFNPNEVVPEFTADTGNKKGEKVDYAILKEGKPQILIECKKAGVELNKNHIGQLFRYFTVTHARLAILTNGVNYQLFTDLETPNRMDETPFLEFNISSIDEHYIPEIKKLCKDNFDVESMVATASKLNYSNKIQELLEKQFEDPEEDFVRFFASRIYSGMITPKVKEQFKVHTKDALTKFLYSLINKKLQTALNPTTEVKTEDIKTESSEGTTEEVDQEKTIVTTADELEGFYTVKSILRKHVEGERIVARDTLSYFGILLDDNNRKPLCRLHFNAKQYYIGFLDENKNETRHPISNIDEIYNFEEDLIKSLKNFL